MIPHPISDDFDLFASKSLDLLVLPRAWHNPSFHATPDGPRWFWVANIPFAAATLRAFNKSIAKNDQPSAKMWAGFGEILEHLGRRVPNHEAEIETMAAAGPVKLPEIPVLPRLVELGDFPKWVGWELWRDHIRSQADPETLTAPLQKSAPPPQEQKPKPARKEKGHDDRQNGPGGLF